MVKSYNYVKKLINIGFSRAVVIPAVWFTIIEKKGIKKVKLTLNKDSIVIKPLN